MLKLSIVNYLKHIKDNPVVFIAGSGIFLIAVFGASVKNVASTVLAVWLLVSFLYVTKWPSYWSGLLKYEKWIVFGFIMIFVSGILSYYNVVNDHQYVKEMGRTLRYVLIIPIYLAIRNLDKQVYDYFIAGVVASGPVFLAFALSSGPLDDDIPASGQYHHIIFGDIAMLNAVLMMGYLITVRTKPVIGMLIAVSALCALYACLLSLTRGAWILIPVIAVVFIVYLVKAKRLSINKIILATTVLTIIVTAVPQIRGPVIEKTMEAYHEIELFKEEKGYHTSVGGRLALWQLGIEVWQRHPLLGTGPGDFIEEVKNEKSKGNYRSLVVHGSVHSIYFHSLAVTGVIGFMTVLMALIILPGLLFIRARNGINNAVAISGQLLIISFAVFGLTEAWLLRAPMVSVYLGYFVICSAQLVNQYRSDTVSSG